MRTLRVLVLTKYGRLGASSRLRSLQYIPLFEAAGLNVTVRPLLADELLQARYDKGGYHPARLWSPYLNRVKAMMGRKQFDVLWIEKEALPWLPLWLERMLLSGVPYVLDYDDAVFHTYDQHRSGLVRYFFGRRLDGLMSRAAIVTVGNGYLERRAKDAGAISTEIIPTVIDLERYPQPAPNRHVNDIPYLVWIGSPATVHYLQVLYEPLRILADRVPFVLRVIGGGHVEIPGVEVEVVKWTEATEVASISSAAIGIMPLIDSSWERGKCGYKLIQYMACGLPVVASAVGANIEIVEDGESGFLASTAQQWIDTLELLLANHHLREKMGHAGRQRVEAFYCIQKTGPIVIELLSNATLRTKTCVD